MNFEEFRKKTDELITAKGGHINNFKIDKDTYEDYFEIVCDNKKVIINDELGEVVFEDKHGGSDIGVEIKWNCSVEDYIKVVEALFDISYSEIDRKTILNNIEKDINWIDELVDPSNKTEADWWLTESNMKDIATALASLSKKVEKLIDDENRF